MKCKVCGGTGTSNTCVNGTFKPCTFCDGTGEYEPFDADIELDKLYPTEQTEQEYIQTCNKAVNLKFACKMSKFERTAFYLIANSGHLKRHPLERGELTVILEDILCVNAEQDK